ncbi:MAG: glycosyltransferase [Planctomycetota bacterium]
MLDFSSIQAGGGVQQALSFLDAIERTSFCHFDLSYLFPGKGELRPRAADFNPARTLVAPAALPRRLLFLRSRAVRFLLRNRVQAVFTLFGPGVPHPPGVASVVGVAYSDIGYPSGPFWDYMPRRRRWRRRLINVGRRRQLRKATCLLAETTLVKTQLSRSLPFALEKIHVIPPAPSRFVADSRADVQAECRSLLLLSGPARHKNLWRLYDVAELAARERLDFRLVLTVRRHRWIRSLPDPGRVDDAVIDRYFDFVGPVPCTEIGPLYESCDILMNLSDLESFTNNYVESWQAGLPLLCSDRDFARHICGGSALYVEPHRPESVLRGIQRLMGSPELRTSLAAEGKKRLAALPSLRERYDEIARIICSEISQRRKGQDNE